MPLHNEIQELVTTLANHYLKENDTYLDIGCSKGETITNFQKLHKNLNIIGIEPNKHTSTIARSRTKAEILTMTIQEATIPNNISVITLLYTIQHIKEQQETLSKLYDNLKQGGILILVDKIRLTNPTFAETFANISNSTSTNPLSYDLNQFKTGVFFRWLNHIGIIAEK